MSANNDVFGIRIKEVTKYRSRPKVNQDPDMVRVTLDMSVRVWIRLQKLMKDKNNGFGEGSRNDDSTNGSSLTRRIVS